MDVGAAGNIVQETPSQEYEYADDEVEEDEDAAAEELDLEDEGFLAQPPLGRSANYNAIEDKLICKAWKKVALDAAMGTEQPGNTYWNRMTEYFNANTNGSRRSMESIRGRWKTINADYQKWAGCLAHVNRVNPSGTNEEDWVNFNSLFLYMINFLAP